jgi:hypothetical protein
MTDVAGEDFIDGPLNAIFSVIEYHTEYCYLPARSSLEAVHYSETHLPALERKKTLKERLTGRITRGVSYVSLSRVETGSSDSLLTGNRLKVRASSPMDNRNA